MNQKELLERKKKNIDHSFEVEKIFSDRIFWVSGAVFTLLTAFHEDIDRPFVIYSISLAGLAVIFELISLHCAAKSYEHEINITNKQIKNPKADDDNCWTVWIDRFTLSALVSVILSLSLFVSLLLFNTISHEPPPETSAKTSAKTTAGTGEKEVFRAESRTKA